MRPSKVRLIWLAVAASTLLPLRGAGLTIYRIGNPDLSPPPEAGAEGVRQEQLSWEEASQGANGVWDGVILENGRLFPIRVLPDENLSLTAADRGGGARGRKYPAVEPQADVTDWTIDGDPTTGFTSEHAAQRAMGRTLTVYLGGRFPVRRVRFYPTTGAPGLVIESFRLYGSDRNGAKELLWSTTHNTKPTLDLHFPSRTLHRIELQVDQELWDIAEYEVYGEGYVAEAVHQSRVLDLGAPATIGPLRWGGFRDRDGWVNIRTRSGADADPNRYWRYTGRGDEITFFTPEGVPLTRDDYDNLSGGQPEITADLDNWSFWSGPHNFDSSTGAAIVSPSPRRFLQLQTEFVPKGLHGAGLDFLEFRVSQPPVSGRIVGEVWPAQATPSGVAPFVLALLPELRPDTPGFDRLVMETTGHFAAVDSVRIHGERVASTAEVDADRLTLSLPRMRVVDNQKLVEIFFRARIFHFGTPFAATVYDSDRPLEVGQPVEAGDATFRLDSNRLWVSVALRGELVQEVAARPRMVTPNGDNINDAAQIVYTVLKLVGEGRVEVGIFDLAGGRVRLLYRGGQNSGRYALTWDGRRDDGTMVAPGLYLFQVRLDTDEGETRRGGVIAVAY